MSAGTPIFAQQHLAPEVLRYMNTHIFAPWVARRVHLRRWLLERADPAVTVSESLLRTVEAYFETVPRDELARARGVKEPTMDSMVKDVTRTWGLSLASLLHGDRIRVRRSAHQVRFLHPRGWSYYATLRKKLHWNEGVGG